MRRSGNRTAITTQQTATIATKTRNKNVATMAVEPKRKKKTTDNEEGLIALRLTIPPQLKGIHGNDSSTESTNNIN